MPPLLSFWQKQDFYCLDVQMPRELIKFSDAAHINGHGHHAVPAVGITAQANELDRG